MASAALAGLTWMASHIALAQSPTQPVSIPAYERTTSSTDIIQSLQKDVKTAKKQVIAANIELTAEQAQAFWPVYDRYVMEMTPLLERKLQLISGYINRAGSLTDDDADEYITGRAETEEAILRLRAKYVPIFRKVLPAKTAALFTQIDYRLDLMLDMELTAQQPLIEP
jgi:hypothetical protein